MSTSTQGRPFVRLAAALTVLAAVAASPAGVTPAFAQAPPPPPPVWTGTFGAGFAVTNGNADTSTYNLAFAVTHDPMSSPLVWKADALYLRGSNEGTTNVNRSTVGLRTDYAFTERTSLYGQFRHLRDTFKQIDYLLAPTAGIAHKIVTTPRTLLAVDVGVGAVLEKNAGTPSLTSGAINIGESFSFKLTETSTVTQYLTGLSRTNDLNDALFTFGAGLAANITPRTAIKLEVLEIYKNQPPPGVLKQDVSVITSLTYTF